MLGAGRAWGQEPEGYEAPDFKDLVASLQGLFEIVRANEVTLRFMKERGRWKLDAARFVATSGGAKTPWDCGQVRKRAARQKSPFWTEDILCERLEKQVGLKR